MLLILQFFQGLSPPLGNKPFLIFRGDSFEHNPVYEKTKTMFIGEKKFSLITALGSVTLRCLQIFSEDPMWIKFDQPVFNTA